MDQLCCWMQPAPRFRKYGCIKGMAKFPGTNATHRIISGHLNGLPDFLETIRAYYAENLAHLQGCAPRPAQGQVVQRPWKDEQAHNFQCDGIISINPCFEAAMEAIQSRGLARNEVERPIPALNLRNSRRGTQQKKIYVRKFLKYFIFQKTFYSSTLALCAKVRACQSPVGHLRARRRPCF